ncbi:MAG: hypothetical protein NC400_12320 [Clostridium sp.]|nr:hypothetical protein [Clostridium sp.]
MSEQDYFGKALSNFTFEAASGGAIRHLTDLGYTVKQIRQRLDFPAPCEKVRRAVWDRLLETGVLLKEEPGSGKEREKAEYVEERDKYGRTSFRRVPSKKPPTESILWREIIFDGSRDGRLGAYLLDKLAENGEEESYLSCDFGLKMAKNPKQLERELQILNDRQRDYLLGLPWEASLCYHRLNRRMLEIAEKLYENGSYQGSCYFLQTGEKILIEKEKGKNEQSS